MLKYAVISTLILALTGTASTLAQGEEIPRTSWGVPDFQGNWRNNTAIPMTRPPELGTQRAYSKEEIRSKERALQEFVEKADEPIDPNRPAPKVEPLPSIGNYDVFWTDRGLTWPSIDGEFRTSLVIDPPNGQIPERVTGFQRSPTVNSDGPEGRILAERCLLFFNVAGPVMLKTLYNGHLMIHQSPGYVVITSEMINDSRIIKITDERDELRSAAQQRWMGDPIGRWEGDTLIVETKNYHPQQTFNGAMADNLTIIETLRFDNNDKLIYGFTVDDPRVYTAQWSGEAPITRMDAPLYEYACHEGNYSMSGILGGARRLEHEEKLGITRGVNN